MQKLRPLIIGVTTLTGIGVTITLIEPYLTFDLKMILTASLISGVIGWITLTGAQEADSDREAPVEYEPPSAGNTSSGDGEYLADDMDPIDVAISSSFPASDPPSSWAG